MKYNRYKILKEISDTKEPIAIVLGCHVTGLAVTRNLGRKRIPVICLDPDPLQVGFFSKYCKGIRCPDPYTQKKKFIDFVIELGEELNQKGVLISTDDMYSIETLKNRKKLMKNYYFTMADNDISIKLINKLEFYKTLESYGIDHPKTYYPRNLDELHDIIENNKIEFPCYIKPIYSCYFKRDFQVKMFIARSKKELLLFYKKAKFKQHEVLIQEFIPGKANDSYCFNAYFNKASEPVSIRTYRRIREWPPMRGCSCLIEKAAKSKFVEVIIEVTSNLMKNIGYYGIVDAEFKRDQRDGKLKLIEINPRPWMQIDLSAKCGIDYCYIAYMDAIGREINLNDMDLGYSKWIFFYDDLRATIFNAINNELTLEQWRTSLRGKKDYAFYSKDDMLPFLVFNSKLMFLPMNYLIRLLKSKVIR